MTHSPLTKDDLIHELEKGCKPREDWRIGLEHELLSFHKDTGNALTYEGPSGIHALMQKIVNDHGWTPILEKGNPIALSNGPYQLTLEPAGQVEFSGSPLNTLSEIEAEYKGFIDVLTSAADALGIGLKGLGFAPEWTNDDIHWMPKTRYDVMKKHMEAVGNHGVDMMVRTCTAQVNMDFDSEADMVKKFRVGLALQPLTTGLFANSHMAEGKDSGYASYRMHLWEDVDPHRTGAPEFVFEDGMGFERYVDFALDVPILFAYRNGKYIDVSGQSFRSFIDGKLIGLEGDIATTDDWHVHISTIFTDVRLKKYLELRGADSVSPDDVMALPAMWKGIYYDQAALDNAYDVIKNWSGEYVGRLRASACKDGLNTVMDDGRTFHDFAQDILNISADGLGRIEDTGAADTYLAFLYSKLENAESIANIA